MRHSIALCCVLSLSACSTASPEPRHLEPSHPRSQAEVDPAHAPAAPPDRLLPPAPASAPLVEQSALSTPGRLRLGHYATRDGLVGLVIDRSGPVPLTRVDGSREVFELAVRRSGSVTELVSLEEEVVITIAADGRHALGRGTPEMSLIRDGDAAPLTAAAAPMIDSALLRRLEQAVVSRCGATVRFADVELASGAKLGLLHGLHRAARALSAVCTDDLGKTAVKRRVKAVRLTQISAGPPDMRLESGELRISARYDEESFGPFADELRSFLESHL